MSNGLSIDQVFRSKISITSSKNHGFTDFMDIEQSKILNASFKAVFLSHFFLQPEFVKKPYLQEQLRPK